MSRTRADDRSAKAPRHGTATSACATSPARRATTGACAFIIAYRTNHRIIKSGTDFRDLSSATLNLSAPDDNAIRRRVIDTMTGKHHYVVPSSPTSPAVDKLVNKLLGSVTKTLSQPVCFSITPFDARSEVVRTRESSLGNWTADVLLHAYDESLVDKKIVITKNPDHDSKLTISSGEHTGFGLVPGSAQATQSEVRSSS